MRRLHAIITAVGIVTLMESCIGIGCAIPYNIANQNVSILSSYPQDSILVKVDEFLGFRRSYYVRQLIRGGAPFSVSRENFSIRYKSRFIRPEIFIRPNRKEWKKVDSAYIESNAVIELKFHLNASSKDTIWIYEQHFPHENDRIVIGVKVPNRRSVEGQRHYDPAKDILHRL